MVFVRTFYLGIGLEEIYTPDGAYTIKATLGAITLLTTELGGTSIDLSALGRTPIDNRRKNIPISSAIKCSNQNVLARNKPVTRIKTTKNQPVTHIRPFANAT
jgi:hypothetical protein